MSITVTAAATRVVEITAPGDTTPARLALIWRDEAKAARDDVSLAATQVANTSSAVIATAATVEVQSAQAAADRAQTGQDRAQTGQDRAAAGAWAADALQSAGAAAAARNDAAAARNDAVAARDDVQLAVANAAARVPTLAALAAVAAAEGAVGEVYADGANNGTYRRAGGAWALVSTATLPALDARATQVERLAGTLGEIVPLTGLDDEVAFGADGTVLAATHRLDGEVVAVGGALASAPAILAATAGLPTRTAQVERLAGTLGEIVPLTGLDDEIVFAPSGTVLAATHRMDGEVVAVGGALASAPASLTAAAGLLTRTTVLETNARLTGEAVPLTGLDDEVAFGADGTVLAASPRHAPALVASGGVLRSLPDPLAQTDATAGLARRVDVLEALEPGIVPLMGLDDEIEYTPLGAVTRARSRQDGWLVAVGGALAEERTLYGGGGGAGIGGSRLLFARAAGLSVLSDPVDTIVLALGQSYAGGGAADWATSEAYNYDPIPGAWMPDLGTLPGSGSFSALVPLRSLCTPAAKFNSGEDPLIELGRTLVEEAAAAGLTPGRIIVAGHSHGGQLIQALMWGGTQYAILMDIAAKIVELSRAAGRRPVFVAVNYNQGEANRASGATYATRASWAMWLGRLQQRLEADLRTLSGQIEPVPLVTQTITRTHKPATVSLGAIDAMLAAPGRILVASPQFAVEHAADTHPTVQGYRRMGRYLGRAVARGVLGLTHKPFLVTRWWMQSATEFRFAADAPFWGAQLVLDTSNAIVQTAGLPPGLGWTACDRDGAIPVTAAAVNVARHPIEDDGVHGSITLSRAPHEGSLVASYGQDHSGGLGGAIDGPRGCWRADNTETAAVLGAVHDWLLPAECN